MTIFKWLTDLFKQENFNPKNPLTEFKKCCNDNGSSQWSLKVYLGLWSRQVEVFSSLEVKILWSTTMFIKDQSEIFLGFLSLF